MKKDNEGIEKIRPLTLVIDKDLWHNFKIIVSASDKTINEYVVQMVKDRVKLNEKEVKALRDM